MGVEEVVASQAGVCYGYQHRVKAANRATIDQGS